MSAYLCEDNHFQYLVWLADRYRGMGQNKFRWFYEGRAGTPAIISGKSYPNPWHEAGEETDLDQIGQILFDANAKSVGFRYRENPETDVFKFKNQNWTLDPKQAIWSCWCYDYQACEPDDYKDSEAKAIIDALISSYTHILTEGDHIWGAPLPLGAQGKLIKVRS